jgi:uncharacterized protein
MKRYYALSTYLRRRYGARVRKIPLDAGFTCPNRDGTTSSEGCVFCSPSGSGTALGINGMSLESQWGHWLERASKRPGKYLFWAYLQSFSNTHGPIVKLERTIDRVCSLPGVSGLCIGTRPDCLDGEKLDLIAGAPFPEIWLELGLQSSSDATLSRINRGHDSAAFTSAVLLASGKGLKICVHVIAGLPGEGEEEFLNTIDFLNRHPVNGIKLHNLCVSNGSALARSWQKGEYAPLQRSEYVRTCVRALVALRPDIVVHRLNADPGQEELLAPEWAMQKTVLLGMIRSRMEELDVWQGKASGAAGGVPEWFSSP